MAPGNLWSDAVAGVVNIVTRRNFTGAEPLFDTAARRKES